jgi:type II secretory ATPase GspE/PulE/Tfp pilus assembly ATPase PilB-like protein
VETQVVWVDCPYLSFWMRDKLVNRATESEVRALSRQKGYGGLLDSGVSKMLQGLTTAEEVLRVTFTEDTTV